MVGTEEGGTRKPCTEIRARRFTPETTKIVAAKAGVSDYKVGTGLGWGRRRRELRAAMAARAQKNPCVEFNARGV